MKKFVIIGSPGAGKSTLAQELGSILDIHVYHLDNYFWQKGWKERSREDRIEIEREHILTRHQWIIEGCYLSTSESRLHEADTIIVLDTPPLRCAWRAFKRSLLFHGRTRPDLPPGCTERFSLAFIKKILFFPYREREQLLTKIAEIQAFQAKEPNQKTIISLHSRKDVEDFLRLQAYEQQEEYTFRNPKLVC